MANVYDSSLLPDTISMVTETILGNRLAPLNAFTRNYTDQLVRSNDTLQVPIASATSATSVNPATFEPGSATTIDKATITVDHLVQFFGLSATDVQNGRTLEQLVEINAIQFANKILSVALVPVTTVNFGVAVVTTETITPGSGHLSTLWAAVHKAEKKVALLNSTIYSKLIPTNRENFDMSAGAYGFDGFYCLSSFDGAVASLKGVVLSNRAIGTVAALPRIDEAVRSQFLSSRVVNLPGLDMSIAINVWGTTSSRAVQATMEVMFGSKAILTSGTAALII